MNMDVREIEKYIPHRYPMLLVDKIVEFEEFKRVVAIKNVSANEWFFPGHFPGNPVMPGVLLVEAMAQAAGVLAVKSMKEDKKVTTYFMSIDSAKFRKPVFPGDQLRLEVEVARTRGNVWKFAGKAYVGEQVVAETNITAMVTEKEL